MKGGREVGLGVVGFTCVAGDFGAPEAFCAGDLVTGDVCENALAPGMSPMTAEQNRSPMVLEPDILEEKAFMFTSYGNLNQV